MNITEVRVKLMRNRSDRLRAFCSITIDGDFVVHDLRVIEGRKGLFVAMPSRKLTDNCPGCGGKNELRAAFCGECGKRLGQDRADKATEKSHVDVAHPINTPCRETLQETVLAAYRDVVAGARDETLDEEPLSDEVDESPEETDESPWEEPEEEAARPVLDVFEDDPPSAAVSDEPAPCAGDLEPDDESAVREPEPEPEPDEEPEEAPAESPSAGSPSRPRSRADRKRGGFGEGIL
ncbi:MAG: stage V sporulation protein G [Candidatus Brocadiaceae bacterium]|nr:stage V sporulation protein G [Candidatus Brocadiaceae bacterium]